MVHILILVEQAEQVSHTFNCSTASSFVAAAGGAKITSTVIKQFLANLVVQTFLHSQAQTLIMKEKN